MLSTARLSPKTLTYSLIFGLPFLQFCSSLYTNNRVLEHSNVLVFKEYTDVFGIRRWYPENDAEWQDAKFNGLSGLMTNLDQCKLECAKYAECIAIAYGSNSSVVGNCWLGDQIVDGLEDGAADTLSFSTFVQPIPQYTEFTDAFGIRQWYPENDAEWQDAELATGLGGLVTHLDQCKLECAKYAECIAIVYSSIISVIQGNCWLGDQILDGLEDAANNPLPGYSTFVQPIPQYTEFTDVFGIRRWYPENDAEWQDAANSTGLGGLMTHLDQCKLECAKYAECIAIAYGSNSSVVGNCWLGDQIIDGLEDGAADTLPFSTFVKFCEDEHFAESCTTTTPSSSDGMALSDGLLYGSIGGGIAIFVMLLVAVYKSKLRNSIRRSEKLFHRASGLEYPDFQYNRPTKRLPSF